MRSPGLAGFLILLAGSIVGEAAVASDYGILEYGRECAERIAEVPVFDCTKGVLARITVDGKEPAEYRPHMTCDRPALLPPGDDEKHIDGPCVPFSRALVLRDDAEVQISAFCRKKLIRPENSHLYDEIDVILHSVTTGSTCWFSAKPHNPMGNPDIGLDGRRVPPPHEATPPHGKTSAVDFWQAPAKTAGEKCASCHDNDPFYYSPYIAQTGQLPADPLGKYANDIGAPFIAWGELESLVPRGNTCTGCHRIGRTWTCGGGLMESIGGADSPGLDERAKSYPYSHWMPVDNLWTERQWETVYLESINQLLDCCDTADSADCPLVAIPGGGSR